MKNIARVTNKIPRTALQLTYGFSRQQGGTGIRRFLLAPAKTIQQRVDEYDRRAPS